MQTGLRTSPLTKLAVAMAATKDIYSKQQGDTIILPVMGSAH